MTFITFMTFVFMTRGIPFWRAGYQGCPRPNTRVALGDQRTGLAKDQQLLGDQRTGLAKEL